MTSEHDVARIVRSWLREGGDESVDRLLTTVLDQLDTIAQRRSTGWARRFAIMNTSAFRYGVVAAALVSLVLLAMQVLPGPTIGPTPSTTPTSSATAVDLVHTQERLSIDGTVTTVTFGLPRTGYAVESTFAWAFTIQDRSSSLQITVADVTGATVHVARFTQQPLEASTASEFLEALDESSSYTVADAGTATIGGRPSVVARINAEGPAEGVHLDVSGEGGVLSTTPNITYFVDVDGAIIMVQASAETDAELDVSRGIVQAILASIRLTR